MVAISSPWSLTNLEELLAEQEWQAADHVTLSLLLEASYRIDVGWLDETAIAQLSCGSLQAIDQLWQNASGGNFGFSAQAKLYVALNYSAYDFCKAVNWLMFPLRPVGFFKFYDFLDFSLGAPTGHLPALWYWRLSWLESIWVGGFGTGRGAGFWDPHLLDAMMLRLNRCQFVLGKDV